MTKEIEKQLKAAGRASLKARAARERAARDLDEAIKLAVKAGYSKSDIAKTAGIHRVTVYEVIKRM